MMVHATPVIILPSHRDRSLPRPPGRQVDSGAPTEQFQVPESPARQSGRELATHRDISGTENAPHPGITPHASAPLITQQLHQLWALQGMGYNAGFAADAYRRTSIPFAKGDMGDISVTA